MDRLLLSRAFSFFHNGGEPGGGGGAENPPAVVPGGAPVTPPATNDISALPDWAQTLINSTRTEAANHKTELQKLQDAEAERQRAALSETERLKQDADAARAAAEAAKAQLKATTLQTQVMLGANKLGIVDPDAAFRLLDTSKVEFAEDGSPKNVETLLSELTAAKPYLIGAVPGGSATNPPRSGSTLTMEQIAKMTPDQINANWDAVQKTLAAR